MEKFILENSLKSLPKKEVVAVRHYNKKHQLIYVTSFEPITSTYKLYEIQNDKLIFTKHKNKAANNLETYINYNKEV